MQPINVSKQKFYFLVLINEETQI